MVGPLVTAHDGITPFTSSRKSQCSRVARCSCTTKRSFLEEARLRVSPLGSGVAEKSRLRTYSASGLADVFRRLLCSLVPHVAFGLVVIGLHVVADLFDVRSDAVAERHAVAFDGALRLLGAGLHALLAFVERVVHVTFDRVHRPAERVVVAAIH